MADDTRAPLVGQTLGQRIRSAYLNANFNRSSFARYLGVHNTTIYSWEDDEKAIKHENLRAVADATGYSIDELEGLAPGERSPRARTDESEHPYPAWAAFLEIVPTLPALGVKSPTEAELAELERRRWKTGNPTVQTYVKELETLRTLVPSHQLEAGHQRTKAAKDRVAAKGGKTVSFEKKPRKGAR